MPILKLAHITSVRIEEGDAGVIVKADGSIRVFTTGAMEGRLTAAQEDQTEKVMVLVAVLSDEELYAAVLGHVAEHSADLVDLGALN